MKPYYFLHLEVPYKMGAVHGMVNMFSQKGFLMAEIPYWDNAIHGRVVVHYPFVQDKKAIEKSDKRELKRISKLKGKQRKLAGGNSAAAVVMRMNADNSGLAVFELSYKILDLVGVGVRRTHFNGIRQVQNNGILLG